MHYNDLTVTSQLPANTSGSLGQHSTGTVIKLDAIKTEVIQALQEAQRDCEEAKLLANAEYFRVIIEKLMDPTVRLIREPRP